MKKLQSSLNNDVLFTNKRGKILEMQKLVLFNVECIHLAFCEYLQ